MVERKTFLRVLYTINSSPQYILARSQTRIPVEVISYTDDSNMPASPDTLTSPPLYANVLLKTCLDTICRSSPELTQDSNRDFSIYVLDPLESNSAPAPVNISTDASSANNQLEPRGVAVGLGCMSWAMTGEDSNFTTVVGTLVKQANGQEALQVIFLLRETMAMKKQAWTIQPTSSQPSSSQESLTSLNASQGNPKPPNNTHAIQSSNTVQGHSSSADLTRETLASIHMRGKPKVKPKVKPPKPPRQSTIVTESDKLLNAGTYIGPVKKKGRPKASGTETKPNFSTNAVASGAGSSVQPKDIIVIDGSDSEGTHPRPIAPDVSRSSKATTSTKSIPKRRANQPMPPPYTTAPLVPRSSSASTEPVQVKVEPQEGPSVLNILALLSAASSEPTSQNAAILTALSTIDSTTASGKAPENNVSNPHLISALKQLLSVYAQPGAPPINPETTAPEVTKHHHSSSHSQEVIVVDKENVNPVVHRKDVKGTKSVDSTTHSVSSSPGTSHRSAPLHQERHLHSLGRSSRSNENTSEKNSPKEAISNTSADKIARKRTLSDFMDEREKGKHKGKGKEREKGEKREGERKSVSQRLQKTPIVDSLRHYPQILASSQPRVEQPANYYRMPLESMTSPVRPRPDFDEVAQEDEQRVFNMPEPSTSQNLRQCRTPSPPPPPRVSASSPVRGPHHEARRKYVVPEWARTNTSMKPRLSEEAQRALEEAEERKRQERIAARKKLPSAQAKLKNEALCPSKSNNTDNTRVKPLAPPTPPSKAQNSRGPITVSDKPMFAAANIHFPFVYSSRPSSPTPQTTSSPVNHVPKTPKTPTRPRRVLDGTPGREDDSLFTPMGSGSLFGSARSMTGRTPLPPSILTSPLGNRKKAKLTPMRSILTKGFEIVNWANSSSSAPNSSDSKDMEDDDVRKSDLDRELEDAFEDLDCPPSSLPIASSDMDTESSTYPPSYAKTENLDQDLPVKQHWTGLPPSSPPAPSSPMLLPEAEQSDEEMDDLPIATSDSETDTDMHAGGVDTPSPAIFSPHNDDDSPTETTDLSLFSLPEDIVTNMDSISSSELFEQFTNLNDHSDAFAGMSDIGLDPGVENMFQNGLEAMDFTEFWATFMPMVDDNTNNSQEQVAATYINEGQTNSSLLSFGEIDHAKLADDMQTLLSGCLM